MKTVTETNQITNGVIWKQLLKFFFPILFGTFFQMLYNTVDAIIVGQVLGKQALAAVGGGTGTFINLIIGFFSGLAAGTGVVISQKYGAEDKKQVDDAVHTTIALAIISSVIITVLGLLSSKWALQAIDTPEDILPLALDYLNIFFAGSFTLVFFNIGTGIFRSIGDSRHPLYFLIIGTVCNIFLDILLVAILPLGVKGAAYATVLSQGIAMVFTFIWLKKGKNCIEVHFRKIKVHKYMLLPMLKIGCPSGIQSVMYGISNIIIQKAINGFGTDTAAAWAAYGKLDAFFWMTISAFGIAIMTFVGQNYGAGKFDRVKQGVRTCTLQAVVTTVSFSIIYILFSNFFYHIFTNDEEVIKIGMTMVYYIAPTFVTFVAIEILSGAIRGAGKSFYPMIISIFGICILRLAYIWIIPYFSHTIEAICLSYPFSWIITSILYILYYLKGNWLTK